MDPDAISESKILGTLILDVGISLLHAGASCNRIRVTIKRFASAYNYSSHITIGPKSVSLSLNDDNGITIFNGIRSTAAQGVDFKMISLISRLSWKVVKEKLSIEELKNELTELHKSKPHPRYIILLFVSLAGAAFCYTFGGNLAEMLITAGATLAGLFAKQQLVKYQFNPYVITYIAALIASLFTGAFYAAGLHIKLENAFSTCVLFLIPGVPLINCFTDLIDGNISNGIVRGVNALIHAMAIAFGLVTTMLIYNVKG